MAWPDDFDTIPAEQALSPLSTGHPDAHARLAATVELLQQSFGLGTPISVSNLESRVTTLEQAGGGGGSGVVFNVKDYGATGDGVTDDADAIQATVDAAVAGVTGPELRNTILFPPGVYAVSWTWIPGPCIVTGYGAVLKAHPSGMAANQRGVLQPVGDHIRVEGLTIDANQELAPVNDGFFAVLGWAAHTELVDCRITNCWGAVQCGFNAPPDHWLIERCRIDHWWGRAIAPVLVNPGDTEFFTIKDCIISDCVGRHEDPRSVIWFDQSWNGAEPVGIYRNVRITGNICLGRGTEMDPEPYYREPEISPGQWTFQGIGTSDQIHTGPSEHVVVTGNISMFGGDLGASFSHTHNLVLADNIFMFNGTNGFAFEDGDGLTATGNICTDNGGAGWGGAQVGQIDFGGSIQFQRLHGAVCSGNVLGNTFQGRARARSAYQLFSCSNVALGPDTILDGGVSGFAHYDDAGWNSDVRFASSLLIGTTAPTKPQNGDLWVDTSS